MYARKEIDLTFHLIGRCRSYEGTLFGSLTHSRAHPSATDEGPGEMSLLSTEKAQPLLATNCIFYCFSLGGPRPTHGLGVVLHSSFQSRSPGRDRCPSWTGLDLRLINPLLTELLLTRDGGSQVEVELDLCLEIWVKFKYKPAEMEGDLAMKSEYPEPRCGSRSSWMVWRPVVAVCGSQVVWDVNARRSTDLCSMYTVQYGSH